jgi:phosphorylcholine metabolism protein LicD
MYVTQLERSFKMTPAMEAEPCTRHTVRCPDATSMAKPLRACCRGHIVAMVRDITELLTELQATFWLDYGTLLGAVRNPLLGLPAGIIPHDKDADLSLMQIDTPSLNYLKRKLTGKGYHVTQLGIGFFKVKLSARNHTNVDCFMWRLHADGKLHRARYLQVDQFKGREFPSSWLKPLAMLPWEGMMLPAPADPAAFCAFRYGPAWMTPVAANHDGIRRP